MKGTSEQTAKISKTDFTKIGHTAVSKPQWVGLSSKKTGCDKSESWGEKISYPCLGFFHQNHPSEHLYDQFLFNDLLILDKYLFMLHNN